MTKSHREFKFGTFEDRLAHLCAFLEIDRPDIALEDGNPMLSDKLLAWLDDNEINLDWLFSGNPSALLEDWKKRCTSERRLVEINQALEPEIRAGLLALLKAVVAHNLPMGEPLAVFDEVVKEFRGG